MNWVKTSTNQNYYSLVYEDIKVQIYGYNIYDQKNSIKCCLLQVNFWQNTTINHSMLQLLFEAYPDVNQKSDIDIEVLKSMIEKFLKLMVFA